MRIEPQLDRLTLKLIKRIEKLEKQVKELQK